MRNWRRLLVLWLIAIALPLQGAVASSLRLCGPLHGEPAAAAPWSAAAVGPAAHAHGAATAAHDHGAASAPDLPPAAVDADTSESGAFGAPVDVHCAYCGACSVAALPPALTGVLPDTVPADALRPARGRPAAPSFVTGGPERPPRAVLA